MHPILEIKCGHSLLNRRRIPIHTLLPDFLTAKAQKAQRISVHLASLPLIHVVPEVEGRQLSEV
jgi:hypothetical protein